jgi:formylglycine-generating enzyme required for sulfatase activity
LWCPELVVIPPGEFMMGSTEAEKERPQHQAQIAYSLAVGRSPVTFEEYGHFARIAGREPPYDEGWGRGRRPAINVSWNDAGAYVEWLSAATGQPYRLLSETEWEHACRAGTATRYCWGDDITPLNANYGKSLGKTTEVGSYPANRFGLYDMQGNVWEWVEDRWHDNYDGAPHDSSAWIEGSILAG